MDRKLEQFEKRHQDSMKLIRDIVQEESDIGCLVRYLLAPDTVVCDVMPEAWEDACDTAGRFADLISIMFHALEDDGSISFVAVQGIPCIVFRHPSDYLMFSEFQDVVRSDMATFPGANVDLLHIGVQEFIFLRREHEARQLRDWFLLDYRDNPEGALKHYSNRDGFKQEWITEAEAQKGA